MVSTGLKKSQHSVRVAKQSGMVRVHMINKVVTRLSLKYNFALEQIILKYT